MIGITNKYIDFARLSGDLEYIFLNCFVNKIPAWEIRKRIYKFLGMTIGQGARIGIGTVVVMPENIEIGPRSVINEYCHLDGRGGIKIANDVSISMYSKIISASHVTNSNDFSYYEGKVVIHDHTWIGVGGIVLDSTIIGSGAVVGAGCVIKGLLEERTIATSTTQKKESKRDKVEYKINYKPYFR